jgi:hypothetical protein
MDGLLCHSPENERGEGDVAALNSVKVTCRVASWRLADFALTFSSGANYGFA